MVCGGGHPEMNEDQKKILWEIEKITRTMDMKCFKILGRDVGLDGVVGLIPGVGDTITAGIALWIVGRAWFAFDPWICRCKWLPLLINVGIDLCIGSIPLFGDIFDVYWKANVKNVNIIRRHYGLEDMVLEGDEEEEEEGEADEEGDVEEDKPPAKKKRWGRK